MTNEADTQTPENGEGNPAAGSQEHEIQIPKWRLDKVLDDNRALKDELREMRGLIGTMAAGRGNQNQNEDPSPEELGLDPQVAKNLTRLVESTVKRVIEPQAQRLQAHTQVAYGKAEVAEFLLNVGKGDAKTVNQLRGQLPKIEAYRQRAMREQGIPLSLEFAYKFMRMDEQDARPEVRQNPQPQPQGQRQAAPQAHDDDDSGFPNPSGTQVQRGSAPAANTQKSFEEMSAEEMEAMLQEQGFAKGQVI